MTVNLAFLAVPAVLKFMELRSVNDIAGKVTAVAALAASGDMSAAMAAAIRNTLIFIIISPSFENENNRLLEYCISLTALYLSPLFFIPALLLSSFMTF
jgi:hypothetical protein